MSYAQPITSFILGSVLTDALPSFFKTSTERRPSASMELGTNNPFRQRLSTGPPSPSVADHFSFASSGGRPQSRNPFLDVFDDDNDLDPFPEHSNAHKSNSFDASSTSRPQLSGAAAELFVYPPLPSSAIPLLTLS